MQATATIYDNQREAEKACVEMGFKYVRSFSLEGFGRWQLTNVFGGAIVFTNPDPSLPCDY